MKLLPIHQKMIAANAERWHSASYSVAALSRARKSAATMITHRARYEAIARATGVPWWAIACIHYRESNFDFSTNLANGEPWSVKTKLVPAGRGPFRSFEDAARDALVNCAPYLAQWRDWSIGGALTALEAYNGLGYALRGRVSPYVWSGTSHYVAGKFVRDGVFSPRAVDKQLGCAVLLAALKHYYNIDVFAPAPTARPASPSVATASVGITAAAVSAGAGVAAADGWDWTALAAGAGVVLGVGVLLWWMYASRRAKKAQG